MASILRIKNADLTEVKPDLDANPIEDQWLSFRAQMARSFKFLEIDEDQDRFIRLCFYCGAVATQGCLLKSPQAIVNAMAELERFATVEVGVGLSEMVDDAHRWKE